VVLPKSDDEARQNPMEENWDRPAEPTGFWIETHVDDVAKA
jgi:hypothetical protein